MAKIFVGMHDVPPLPDAGRMFKLGVDAIFSMMRIIGSEFRDGIRHYTPRREWLLYRKCKVVSHRQTAWTARVRIGWVKGDFPRGKFYAVWVGEGTGIHVPGGKKIVARKRENRIPVIRYRYGGGWATLKSVRGQKPQKMLERGYAKAVPEVLFLMSRTMFRTMRVYKHA